ncbi:PIN domain-containing protein [Flavobacterium sp. FlaQc-52]|jgi:hypothetical protein|uniref:PIN domain-containing protein n=1 Tax=Flavobacterium sp. FlaQc-52 TaxID=3374185 RepID=UPI0037564F1D
MVIVIDSTEYRQDRSLNKTDLAYIKDLGSKELIKLHIPWFVYKESTTHSVLEIETELSKIKNTLASLDKRGIAPIDSKIAKDISKSVENFRKGIKDSNKKLWDDFIKDAKAKLHKFDEKHSTSVFESYFNGGKPFKSLKSRMDIPDAFIYITIKKLAKKEIVHLISGDKNLRDKCNGENNIITYENFNIFYNSKYYLAILPKYQKLLESEKIEFATKLLIDYKYVIEEAVMTYTNSVDFLELYETPLHSDGGEATIRAIDEPEVIIEENEIEFLNNQFHVPIIVKAVASVDYSIYKADYWLYDNLPRYSEDLNDYYFLIEDTFPVVMKKTIIISIDDFDEDTEPLVEINEFDEIELDIKSEINTNGDDFSQSLDF